MNLHISPNLLVSDVQKTFNAKFPFLKLEFFSRNAHSSADFSAGHIAPPNTRIGDIQTKITDGELEIIGEMKARDLESHLRNDFGLAAQVFRKSGKLWLETTMSDNWTLNQQNKHGRELSEPVEKKPDEVDFDLQRDSDH